jgi:FkbM family methyltransferase
MNYLPEVSGTFSKRISRWTAQVSGVVMMRQRLIHRLHQAIPWPASRTVLRRALNEIYGALASQARSYIHAVCANVFRENEGGSADIGLRLCFCGQTVTIPLKSKTAWLDWGQALSAFGRELEVKRTYEFLVGLRYPPRLVLDIGAKYGIHALLFQVCDVRAIAFEPNLYYHAVFRYLCSCNSVQCTLEPLALGATEGTTELCLPKCNAWLGSMDPALEQLSTKRGMQRVKVRQTTVDAWVKARDSAPDIIKIDTEENDVLLGSVQTLRRYRPFVVFRIRSGSDTARDRLMDFFEGADYRICALPLCRDTRPEVLNRLQFKDSEDCNFAALPQTRLHDWPPSFIGQDAILSSNGVDQTISPRGTSEVIATYAVPD